MGSEIGKAVVKAFNPPKSGGITAEALKAQKKLNTKKATEANLLKPESKKINLTDPFFPSVKPHEVNVSPEAKLIQNRGEKLAVPKWNKDSNKLTDAEKFAQKERQAWIDAKNAGLSEPVIPNLKSSVPPRPHTGDSDAGPALPPNRPNLHASEISADGTKTPNRFVPFAAGGIGLGLVGAGAVMANQDDNPDEKAALPPQPLAMPGITPEMNGPMIPPFMQPGHETISAVKGETIGGVEQKTTTIIDNQTTGKLVYPSA